MHKTWDLFRGFIQFDQLQWFRTLKKSLIMRLKGFTYMYIFIWDPIREMGKIFLSLLGALKNLVVSGYLIWDLLSCNSNWVLSLYLLWQFQALTDCRDSIIVFHRSHQMFEGFQNYITRDPFRDFWDSFIVLSQKIPAIVQGILLLLYLRSHQWFKGLFCFCYMVLLFIVQVTLELDQWLQR